MAGTVAEQTLLTGGQNEGIERSVLPMPSLYAAQNARMRKTSRWGKRFGHTGLSTGAIGSGTGLLRCAGGADESCFVIADDRCSSYNRTSGTFVDPTTLIPSSDITPRAAPGSVSGWLPEVAFFPCPARSLTGQTRAHCSSCYALGYLWTTHTYADPLLGIEVIRVVATDPTDQTLVFVATVNGTGLTTVSYPKLIACGSTVVLTYIDSGSASVVMSRLTSLAGGFGASTVLDATAGITGYSSSPYSSTQFLFAVTRPASLLLGIANASGSVATTQTATDASGNPITAVSIAGDPTSRIYVGYSVPVSTYSRLLVYTVGLGAPVGTVTLSATDSKLPILCVVPTGGVRCVYSSMVTVAGGGAANYGSFSVRDVSAAAALGTAYSQSYMYPIAIPFAVGNTIYLWAKTELGPNGSAVGYATLIRLPDVSSLKGFGTTANYPIELSVQDYMVSTGLSTVEMDLQGLPFVTRLGTTASYAVPVPTYYSIPGFVPLGNDFRVLQARHYSDTAPRRSVVPVYADSSSFVPLGTLTRVDDRGPVEEGFLYSPSLDTPAGAAGGGLTASSSYYYTTVLKSRNSNGRLEVSAPSVPVKVVLAAGQTKTTSVLRGLQSTGRFSAQIEIYRTLANGQTYYLCQVVDNSRQIAFTDIATDSAIAGQPALYTQVGQTLANCFPPGARFACVGGQRMFLGGLMRPDIVQASKLIFGDQSPSFADNDAFRIVLPTACTGIAWMDSAVMFTEEGMYVVQGDGPDDSGNGDFGNLVRLPYRLGCIEPRSIATVDEGTFFQNQRGLYMLPRGFGAPIPAGDNIMDTLALYPVITGCATVTKATEQTVHWTCCNAAGTAGARIVYDLAHKVWSVDYLNDSSSTTAPLIGSGQWASGEAIVLAPSTSTSPSMSVTNSVYTDGNVDAYVMSLTTGDMRPAGPISEGVISKVDVLAEVRGACTLQVTKVTEFGSAPVSSRAFNLAAGDYQIGDVSVTESELGSAELRAVSALRVQYQEQSTGEGLAFIALAVEHEKPEGLKRVTPLSRTT